MSAGARRRSVPGAALALLAGCASGHINLSVKSQPGTNMDRPMRMLVRKVDPKQYLNESYPEVAAKVSFPDPSVLMPPEIIYPGTVQSIDLTVPKDGPVAIYFLFTAPDGNWEFLLSPPLPASGEVELLANRIVKDPTTAALPGAEPGAGEAPAPPKLEAPKVEVPKLPGG